MQSRTTASRPKQQSPTPATAAEVVGQGTNIDFPPEEDRDVEGYYVFFVFDPDGMRIEIFSWPRSDIKEFC
jgi:hypothetical protein